jgi:hypothetical protein
MVHFVALFCVDYFICTQQIDNYLLNAAVQICSDANFGSHDYRMNLKDLGWKFINCKEGSI